MNSPKSLKTEFSSDLQHWCSRPAMGTIDTNYALMYFIPLWKDQRKSRTYSKLTWIDWKVLALGPPLIRCLKMTLLNIHHHNWPGFEAIVLKGKYKGTWDQEEVCSQESASHVPWQRLKAHGRRPRTKLKKSRWEFRPFPPFGEGSSWISWRQIVSRKSRISFNIRALSSSLQVEI